MPLLPRDSALIPHSEFVHILRVEITYFPTETTAVRITSPVFAEIPCEYNHTFPSLLPRGHQGSLRLSPSN